MKGGDAMPFEVWKGIWIPFAGTLFGSGLRIFHA